MGFLKLWQLKSLNGQIPELKSLPLADLARSIDKIMFCLVDKTTKQPRFRIIHEGSQLVKMFGGCSVGKHVDEAISPVLREDALKCYEQVVNTRRPNFSVFYVKTPNGPLTRYERLLLPFSKKGPFVQGIGCMVSLFTEANGLNFDDISSPVLKVIDDIAVT
jgi:hypothetical protein